MSKPKKSNPEHMSLGDHLEELRTRIIRVLIAVALGLIICLIFGMRIVSFLSQPILDAMRSAGFEDPKMLARHVQEPFVTYVRISLISGFVLASPYVFWQLWQFVAIGLYPHERRYVHIFDRA